MNLILAGLGKILVQLSATFVVLGTAYLLLFAPNANGPIALAPEQVAENLAPIGRVQIARPTAPISTPTQTPTQPPTSKAAPAAPPATTPAPVATAVAVEPVEPAGIGDPGPVVSEAPVATAGSAMEQAPDPASPQIPPAVSEPTPTVSLPSSTVDGPAEASIRLAPDGNGMHGSYRLTPHGIILYPASMIGPNTQLFTTDRVKGSFWATPSGVAHFRLQPTAPVD